MSFELSDHGPSPLFIADCAILDFGNDLVNYCHYAAGHYMPHEQMFVNDACRRWLVVCGVGSGANTIHIGA